MFGSNTIMIRMIEYKNNVKQIILAFTYFIYFVWSLLLIMKV